MEFVSVSTPLPLTVEEANLIIAKYMDVPLIEIDGKLQEYVDLNFGDLWEHEELCYHESIDSLVSVWKKIWTGHNDIQAALGGADIMNRAAGYVYMNGVTITEGATIGTAMVIKEKI